MINITEDQLLTMLNMVSTNEPNVPTEEANIIKALDVEQQIAREVVYLANTEDAHGDWASPETLSVLVTELNKAIDDNYLTFNIHHNSELDVTDQVYIIKTWQTDKDMHLLDKLIPEGSVIADVKYADEQLWDMKKSGKLAGLSIGCLGQYKVEEDA